MGKPKPETPKLTPGQERVRQSLLRLPDGLNQDQLRLFKKAQEKIRFTPLESGSLEVDYEALTAEERFALGVNGTDSRGYFPESVEKMLEALLPRRVVDGREVIVRTVPAGDVDTLEAIRGPIRRLREILREDILDSEEAKKARDGQRKARAQGALSSARVRGEKATTRDRQIVAEAKALLAKGRGKHELSGKLASKFNLTPKTIRTILQDAGLLKKRKSA